VFRVGGQTEGHDAADSSFFATALPNA